MITLYHGKWWKVPFGPHSQKKSIITFIKDEDLAEEGRDPEPLYRFVWNSY